MAGGADGGDLGNQGCDVLIYVRSEYGLDYKYVGPSLYGLDNPQIIDISVLVEVEIGKHVGGVVQQILEVLDCCGLGESRSDCLKVKTKGNIFTESSDSGRCGHGSCPGDSHRRAVCSLIPGVRGNCHYAGCIAPCQHQGNSCEQGNQSFHSSVIYMLDANIAKIVSNFFRAFHQRVIVRLLIEISQSFSTFVMILVK